MDGLRRRTGRLDGGMNREILTGFALVVVAFVAGFGLRGCL
jgi:hypothetical protein